ncbi:MAG TPA: FHA domain-containing protein [Candidatus Acidoferrum sp.]|nr:FHA domain-containing protein [Candidatus Acidoferrum sp.]
MGLILEIHAGPFAGKQILLRTGESVSIGRASAKSQFALPQDTFLSGLHFAVEVSASGCRVVDKKSSNGTFLNGARISDAMLANGDEIKAGQTVFHVKIVADSKLPAPAPPAPQPAPASAPNELPAKSDRAPADVSPIASLMPAPIAPAAQKPQVSSQLPQQVNKLPAQTQDPKSDLPPADLAPAPSARAISPEPVQKPPRSDAKPGGPAPAPPKIKSVPKPLEREPEQSPRSIANFAISVAGWAFPSAPQGWQLQEGFGLQRTAEEEFPSSLSASEEFLGGISLRDFVESQLSTLRSYLREPRIEPAIPPRVEGADEAMAVDVRHSTKDGRELIYRRIFVRSGESVGVLTITTLAADFSQTLQSLQPLLDGAAFRPSVVTK